MRIIARRTVASSALENFVTIVAEKLPSSLTAQEKRQRVLVNVTAMMDAPALSHIINDARLSSEILHVAQDGLTKLLKKSSA